MNWRVELMNKKPNTKAMIEYNQIQSEERKKKVLDAIDKCKAEGDISTKRVCEMANVTRAYFTNHPEMRVVLDNAKKIVNRNLKKKRQSPDSRSVLEKSLRAEIARLNKNVTELEEAASYKSKYEELLNEYNTLNSKLSDVLENDSRFNF